LSKFGGEFISPTTTAEKNPSFLNKEKTKEIISFLKKGVDKNSEILKIRKKSQVLSIYWHDYCTYKFPQKIFNGNSK
jgi:hypothetical protein